MKKAAERLALFFIVVQIDRVATFVHIFQPADTLGYWLLSYGVSIGLAFGVYTSFYMVRQEKVRKAAIAGILLFSAFDLFFNELGIILTVSGKQLVDPGANFFFITARYLENAMEVAAIGYGVLPTLASAVLGWIQGGANKVTEGEWAAPTVWTRLFRGIFKIVDSWAGGIAFRIEGVASKKPGIATPTRENNDSVDGQDVIIVTPKRWPELNREDVAWILANSRKAIETKYEVSNGTAGNWRKDLKAGIMPWQDAQPAKALPQDA